MRGADAPCARPRVLHGTSVPRGLPVPVLVPSSVTSKGPESAGPLPTLPLSVSPAWPLHLPEGTPRREYAVLRSSALERRGQASLGPPRRGRHLLRAQPLRSTAGHSGGSCPVAPRPPRPPPGPTALFPPRRGALRPPAPVPAPLHHSRSLRPQTATRVRGGVLWKGSTLESGISTPDAISLVAEGNQEGCWARAVLWRCPIHRSVRKIATPGEGKKPHYQLAASPQP